MSVLTATKAKGQAYYEAPATILNTHDNASDNMVAGVYSHNPLEGSATEQDEVVSLLLNMIAVGQNGGGAISGVNKTGGSLAIGTPVAFNGYDSGSGLMKFVAADPAQALPAIGIILTAIANNGTGYAYVGTWNGAITSGLNQTAVTLYSPLYLQSGGGLGTNNDTTLPFSQTIGYTVDQSNPGNYLGYVQPPVWNLQSQGGLLMPTVDIDFTAAATTTFSIGGGKKLNPDSCGLLVTQFSGSLSTQPTIEFGITGTNAKYIAAQVTTLLTGLRKREKFTQFAVSGSEDGETAPNFTVTVGATGTGGFAMKGRPYWQGILL